jgi:DNA-binding SARP family transcriptional activator
VKLRTLGSADLHDGDATGSRQLLGVGKPLALLIYLSAAPNRGASRNTLISLLWSDLEPDAAKHALRQTIWYLRRKTERDLVVATGDTLQLAADVATDRDDLLRASADGDRERVVALYSGPFVPAFAAPGGSGFEDWCALERRRLLEVFRHSAEAVVRSRLVQGRARDAIELARKLRDQDLYNESSWRLLIEVCTSADDLLAARAEAEALRQLADQEELELEPATRAALRAARGQPATPEGNAAIGRAAPPGLSGTLVGREAPFAMLLDAFDEARTGKVVRVHITARTGIGKTRLLRDFAARVRGMRGKVVSIGGSLGTREVSYGVAGELAAGLAALPGKKSLATESAATLVGLNPSLSTYFDTPPRHGDPADAMRARTLALRELATAVAFEHPVAILIDDLHWCDEETTALLAAFAGGLHDVKALLVTAGRPEARRLQVVTEDATRHADLEPLTASQVEELLLSIARLPHEEWARDFAAELWRASRGSPLHVLEMVQLLEDRRLLLRENATWQSARPDALMAELRGGDALRGRLEDMDRADRWLLTLLAAAGAPVDLPALAAAAERTEDDVADRLRALEARGLVSGAGHAWQIAHDEITEELLRLAAHEGASRASVRVGRALGATGLFTEARARRAAQLLRSGDDPAARSDLFRRFAHERFELGDRRPLPAIARDLLGPTARAEEVAQLRASAPLTWRLGIVSPARRLVVGVGVGMVVAVTGLALLFKPRPAAPDAVLGLVFVDSLGRATMRSADLREDDWRPQQALPSRPWTGPGAFSVASTNAFWAVWNPRRRVLLTSQSVDDEGTIELFQHVAGAPPRRVAAAPGDDQLPSVSPDGELTAFTSARWDPLSRYDIALLSRDGTVRQLTSGPASDLKPEWSPDGARLAFSRRNWGEAPDELCVITVASSRRSCMEAPAGVSREPVGWIDPDHIAILEVTGGYTRLRSLQWSSGEIVTISEGAIGGPVSLSPDGRWVFCVCATSPARAPRPVVFPLVTPGQRREVDVGDSTNVPHGAFWLSSRATLAPARVLIEATARHAPAGVPIQLRATVLDDRLRELLYHGTVRWSVSDAAAGQVDPLSGLLVASGTSPTVLVRAHAGAAAHDSLLLTVTREPARLVLEETWTDTTLGRWFAYGAPLPSVTSSGGGAGALSNNGDGSFVSGVLSRMTFDAREGLAVEARVSAPVTALQWQTVGLGILMGQDTARYSRARGRNMVPPVLDARTLCDIGFPGEGKRSDGIGAGGLLAGEHHRRISLPSADWLSGAWHTVRLQLLPDGRCGVAFDGEPWAIVQGRERPGSDLRLRLQGNSVGTRMLVGRLRVWEGVPRDIDWTKVKSTP